MPEPADGHCAPSLYVAFGSKEALFIEELDLYQATVNTEIWNALEGNDSRGDRRFPCRYRPRL
jgi:AcrR family transcriptional regulator